MKHFMELSGFGNKSKNVTKKKEFESFESFQNLFKAFGFWSLRYSSTETPIDERRFQWFTVSERLNENDRSAFWWKRFKFVWRSFEIEKLNDKCNSVNRSGLYRVGQKNCVSFKKCRRVLDYCERTLYCLQTYSNYLNNESQQTIKSWKVLF